jgi:type I restriction enzyme, S subunit
VQQAIAAQTDLIAAAQELKRSLMKHLLQDELTDIPSIPLENAVEVMSGGTPATKRSEYWNGEIEWVTAKDVSIASGPFILHTERRITKAGLDNSPAKILPALTTILIARGATMGTVRVIPRQMAMNQTCYGLVAKEGYDPLFLYYMMSMLKDDMLKISYGTIFTTVTTQVLHNLPMRFPQFERQKQIAHILQSADAKIAVEQDRQAALRELFNSLLQELMTGRLRVKGLEMGD